MTTGIARESTAWRGWAAEQLGVSANATPAEARAAFLALLPEVEFVPPPEWRAALRLLTGAANSLPPEVEQEARAEAERRFGERVEDFASEYWSLAVPVRQQRWQGLMRECGWSARVRARLEMLRPGLTIGPLSEGESPQVVELAGHLEALFVLPPAERTAVRLELRQRLRDGMPAWENAAARLWKRYPDRAGLQGSIITELVSWTRMQIYLEKRRRQPIPNPGGFEPGSEGKTQRSAAFIVLCIALGIVCRAIGCSRDQPSPPPSYPTPSPTDPRLLQPEPKEGNDLTPIPKVGARTPRDFGDFLRRRLEYLEGEQKKNPRASTDELIKSLRKLLRQQDKRHRLDNPLPGPPGKDGSDGGQDGRSGPPSLRNGRSP